jgi:subtilisin-like proprotein convertase family protein
MRSKTSVLTAVAGAFIAGAAHPDFVVAGAGGGCCQCFASQQFCTLETEADCVALGGSYLGDDVDCAPPGAITTTSSPNTPLPDGDPVGVSDTITITDSITVNDLSVRIVVNHTWVGDLCVTLSRDGSPPVTLMSRIGADEGGNLCHNGGPFGCSLDNLDVTLDDNAAESIEIQCTANLTGVFRPDPGSLSAFAGLDSAGDWTLNISDNAAADVGTWTSWTLTLSHGNGLSTCEKDFAGQCGSTCIWDCGNFNNNVDTADFLALIGQWGMAGVPCDFGLGLVGVDTPDFLAIIANWGPCQAPHAGNCCAANFSPGCDNVACERAICVIDPTCCDDEWDSTCADLAVLNAACECPGCGNPAAGDCLVSNGSPYCDDLDCCESICTADAFCCDNTWDLLCADAAALDPNCIPPL